MSGAHMSHVDVGDELVLDYDEDELKEGELIEKMEGSHAGRRREMINRLFLECCRNWYGAYWVLDSFKELMEDVGVRLAKDNTLGL
ncbi:hypothetical protein NDU88_005219 [Pleurodeles waltl]|uniref:Uncharacterized protein n=1 Tax=Pleurodeles waltl TaxID=8319 RepID=A0AAV7PJS6_PLEWA|nr:hypothetical protein NDU88_005219 [Pleurodeles waltl]